MDFGFELVEPADDPYGATGPCGTVYAFRKEGQEKSELQKFWEKPEVQDAPDFDALYDRLYDEEEGLLHSDWWSLDFPLRPRPDRPDNPEKWNWIRPKRAPTDPDDPDYHVGALWAPIPVKDRKHLGEPPPSLRLHLFQVPDDNSIPPYSSIFVLGNGGVKDVKRSHEKPELKSAIDELRYVMKRVYRRIEWEGALRITNRGYSLEGEMYFEPDR